MSVNQYSHHFIVVREILGIFMVRVEIIILGRRPIDEEHGLLTVNDLAILPENEENITFLFFGILVFDRKMDAEFPGAFSRKILLGEFEQCSVINKRYPFAVDLALELLVIEHFKRVYAHFGTRRF